MTHSIKNVVLTHMIVYVLINMLLFWGFNTDYFHIQCNQVFKIFLNEISSIMVEKSIISNYLVHVLMERFHLSSYFYNFSL